MPANSSTSTSKTRLTLSRKLANGLEMLFSGSYYDSNGQERLYFKEFDDRFIELARSVYVTNDQRANAKKELNIHLGSEIVEEKSYQDYQ